MDTIAAAAQHDRFVHLMRRSGLTVDQVNEIVSSTAFGPLTAALRPAEAYQHDLVRLLPRIVAAHPVDYAEDVTAVLRYRIETSPGTSGRGLRVQRPRLIAGRIPDAVGAMGDEHRHALDQRKDLIESRTRAVAEQVAGGCQHRRRVPRPVRRYLSTATRWPRQD